MPDREKIEPTQCRQRSKQTDRFTKAKIGKETKTADHSRKQRVRNRKRKWRMILLTRQAFDDLRMNWERCSNSCTASLKVRRTSFSLNSPSTASEDKMNAFFFEVSLPLHRYAGYVDVRRASIKKCVISIGGAPLLPPPKRKQ